MGFDENKCFFPCFLLALEVCLPARQPCTHSPSSLQRGRANSASTGTQTAGIYPKHERLDPTWHFFWLCWGCSSIMGSRSDLLGALGEPPAPSQPSRGCPALAAWDRVGVIHCRAIVLLWQALIYSPGNSFWFKVHIRSVNAP